MKKLLLAAVVAAGFAMCSPAMAQMPAEVGAPEAIPAQEPGHPRVDHVEQRMENQQNRINAGEADGQINAAQGARDEQHLNNEEKHLSADEAKHDGHITKREEHHMDKHMNKSSHKIHKQRHGGHGHHHKAAQ